MQRTGRGEELDSIKNYKKARQIGLERGLGSHHLLPVLCRSPGLSYLPETLQGLLTGVLISTPAQCVCTWHLGASHYHPSRLMSILC